MNAIAHPESSRSVIVKLVIVLLLVTAFMSWLLSQSHIMDLDSHIDYSNLLIDIKRFDSEIDREVLAGRLDLSLNYDALQNQLSKIIKALRKAHSPPAYIKDKERDHLVSKVSALINTLERKKTLIDQYMRKNAVLRNSLAYFRASSEEMFLNNTNQIAVSSLEKYVRYTLYYAKNSSRTWNDKLEYSEALVNSLLPSFRHDGRINNLVLHGRIIRGYAPEVNKLTQQILLAPSHHLSQDIIDTYTLLHGHAHHVSERYNLILFLTGIALLVYLVMTFIHLVKTRESLATSHKEVIMRMEAQAKAEHKLLLHDAAYNSAHEGITLTDEKGIILDVNPAFSRITGYQHDEVIGRNPRVLKSGRHDKDFYDAMWASIQSKGNWRGEIWNRNKYGEIYPELLSISSVQDDSGDVTNYVAVFSDISRIKEQESQLQHIAYHDPLTQLPNRALLADRIGQAIAQTDRSGSSLIICYLDLDGFKPINDTYGHDIGDRVLMEISNRLKASLRGGDTVARLGGDEFVMVFHDLESSDEIDNVANRLLTTIAQPLTSTDPSLSVTASIGMAIYPDDANDSDSLLRHADQAMYQAKMAGKNRYQIFNLEENLSYQRQRDHIYRIELALENEELLLFYQPKVNMRTGQVLGFEALIRWQHPERGLLPPIEFLPLIEDHDLIIKIGEWVIEQVLRQIEEWQANGLHFKVSANVAGRHLRQPDFIQHLRQILDRYDNVPPNLLELEVLETTALEDMTYISQTIEECNKIGVSFALDDFGTGYSSLTYLKRLPASVLKIDQSFVRDMLEEPEDLAIVQGIMGLAVAFQRDTIAEGVETADHGRFLIQMGCELGQGYGISKPIPAERVKKWVSEWKPPEQWRDIRNYYWESEDYALLMLEVMHRRWIALLVHSIQEGLPIPFTRLDDDRYCRFGTWYSGQGNRSYGHLSAFHEIDEPHSLVHKIAGEIDDHYRNGDLEAAKQLLPSLYEQRDSVVLATRKLMMEVGRYNRMKNVS